MARGRHRERLLEEGLRLFTERGFAATGVADITEATGIPKGSFYNYFESKEDFALAVLGLYQEIACSHLHGLLERQDLSPLARLRTLFETWIEHVRASGFTHSCLAGRLAQEVAGENPAFRQPLDHTFSCMQEHLAGCLRTARQAGELSADIEPERLAEFLLMAWQGAMLRAKAANQAAPLEAFLDITFNRLLQPTRQLIS